MDIENIEMLMNYLRVVRGALDVMVFDIKNDIIEYTTDKFCVQNYISREWNNFIEYREENK